MVGVVGGGAGAHHPPASVGRGFGGKRRAHPPYQNPYSIGYVSYFGKQPDKHGLFVIPAKAGIQMLDLTGFPPDRSQFILSQSKVGNDKTE